MSSRVVRVYDGEFPSIDEIRFCDPANRTPWPKEVWAGQMQKHEVALFCVNFKSTGPVLEETGRPGPQSEETCRIFSNVKDAESYARGIVQAHPSTVCILRSKDQREVKRVSNRRFNWKFAFASLIGIGYWVAFAGGIGLTIILFVRGLVRGSAFIEWLQALSLWQWMALVASAVVLGFSALLLKMYLSVRRKTTKFVRAINTSLSPEERARYHDLNALSVSSDPQDREKARQLSKEYSERIMQIRRDMKS